MRNTLESLLSNKEFRDAYVQDHIKISQVNGGGKVQFQKPKKLMNSIFEG